MLVPWQNIAREQSTNVHYSHADAMYMQFLLLSDTTASRYIQRDIFYPEAVFRKPTSGSGAACKSDRESGPLPFGRSTSVMMMVASEQFDREHLHGRNFHSCCLDLCSALDGLDDLHETAPVGHTIHDNPILQG